MALKPSLTAADVRAKLAHDRVPQYVLAARVRLHPARLARYLNEHAPLPASLAVRIEEALRELEQEAE